MLSETLYRVLFLAVIMLQATILDWVPYIGMCTGLCSFCLQGPTERARHASLGLESALDGRGEAGPRRRAPRLVLGSGQPNPALDNLFSRQADCSVRC